MMLTTEPIDGTHIRFLPQPPAAKTERWHVISKNPAHLLGKIGWYGPWRKYVFEPEPFSVFEEVCLREIGAFVEERTKEHRSAKAAA